MADYRPRRWSRRPSKERLQNDSEDPDLIDNADGVLDKTVKTRRWPRLLLCALVLSLWSALFGLSLYFSLFGDAYTMSHIMSSGFPNLTYSNHTAPSPPTILVLTASHLGSGSSTQLRIIAHNLRLIMLHERIKSVLILSHDGARADAQALVNKWLKNDGNNLVTDVMWVEDDPVRVDIAKWMVALHKVKRSLASNELRRVILISDSFLLIRKVPELLGNHSDVLGLVWTEPPNGLNRHIQSYLRSLSAPGALAFMNYYDKESLFVFSVHGAIVKFEENLGWAPTGAQALYEAVAGGHPDNEDAQKELLQKGFPAINLKTSYSVPGETWHEQDIHSRPKVPPSFSADIYRRNSPDLRLLSDEQLRVHFVEFGRKEGRICCFVRPQIKGWLKAFVKEQRAKSIMAILEEHLQTSVLARTHVTHYSNMSHDITT